MRESSRLFTQAYKNRMNDPEHVLFSDANHEYTLTEVDEISAKVYHCLKTKKVGQEDIVMILLSRCVLVGSLFLGVLKAGACAVIIDADTTDEYLNFFLNDAMPTAAITDKKERLSSVCFF